MKSDSSARLVPFPATGPAPDAFRAFFETVDGPAALCDAQMRVLTANAAFEALCGSRDIAGRLLSELMSQVPEATAEGRTEVVEVKYEGERTVTLTFTQRGATVAVLARQLPADALSAAGKAHNRECNQEETYNAFALHTSLKISELLSERVF